MPPGDAIPQAGRCSALAPATGSALFEQGSTAQNRKRKASSSPGTLLFFSRVGPRFDVPWASFFPCSIRLSLEFGATARVFRRRSGSAARGACRLQPVVSAIQVLVCCFPCSHPFLPCQIITLGSCSPEEWGHIQPRRPAAAAVADTASSIGGSRSARRC
jgi:hypothetical protein